MNDILSIKRRIEKIHMGDIQQQKVIFSESSRLIVEAPAGYGKTTTMISRIAYLYSCGLIPNPKKLLGLTFSVNAALKIRRDVSAKLPELVKEKDNPILLKEKLDITNYHGFCKKILKKYGYLLTSLLKKDPYILRAIGKNEIEKDDYIRSLLQNEEISCLLSLENSICNSVMPSDNEMTKYVDIVKRKLLVNDILTHTSLLIFTILLFDSYPEIKGFYQSYYPVIVIDEFQDTNCIAWELLKRIINDNTQLLFLGDSLQRIYGFIGAVPNIMSIAESEYDMDKIELNKNYRFMTNKDMLILDRNLRINAQQNFVVQSLIDANLPGFYGKTQADECSQVCQAVSTMITANSTEKVAILFRGRGKNVDIMQKELENVGIDYFYGMFIDDDLDYVNFHKNCQVKFITKFSKRKTISNYALNQFSDDIKKEYIYSNNKVIKSLLTLLDAFILKVAIDYKDLLPEEKYMFILDVFENKQLKQAMEYVTSNVILSTVHGAKGLEWDYVIVSDLEPWVFPSYSCCNLCENKFDTSGDKCRFPKLTDEDFVECFIEELSVFYVALTRAKKQVYVSASSTRVNNYNQIKKSKYSCYCTLPGIKLVKAQI